MSDFDMDKFETGGATGMDALLASEPEIVSPVSNVVKASPTRIRIGSLQQLAPFQRIASDTLIHKSTNDLWAIRQNEGNYFIERLFQDNGEPLKGS